MLQNIIDMDTNTHYILASRRLLVTDEAHGPVEVASPISASLKSRRNRLNLLHSVTEKADDVEMCRSHELQGHQQLFPCGVRENDDYRLHSGPVHTERDISIQDLLSKSGLKE